MEYTFDNGDIFVYAYMNWAGNMVFMTGNMVFMGWKYIFFSLETDNPLLCNIFI